MKVRPNGRFAFADIYGAGAAIGIAPSEIRALSLWQFAACVNGWNESQKSQDERDRELDDDDADALWAVLDAPPIWARH